MADDARDLAGQRWQEVLDRLERTLVCCDFDGTLAPIVADPDQAHAHPQLRSALLELAPQVLGFALVTGRPVDQVLRLGDLGSVAEELGERGRIEVHGQYGAETWSSRTRQVRSPEPPPEIDELRRRLPRLLGQAGLGSAYVEDKGLAIALHARRMTDPAGATAQLRELLAPVADELGLRLEPGRQVVELRAVTSDKGQAVERLVAELDPSGVVFAGDDLGDLAAYDAVERFRDRGGAGLLVCSGSTEETRLAERADLVVDGPAGVVELLRALARKRSRLP